MSPKYGQPIKEEPRLVRVAVNFTVSEKEKLDEYCKKKGVKLSEVCREEVLKVINTKTTQEETELRKLRKIAKANDWKISKGYLTERLTNKAVKDINGNKIVGYTITDSSNAYIAGLTSEEIFTMNFEELKGFIKE